ncbi:MAG TPA: hypothetical protein VHT51_20825 [Micropepsaceae bacterium]|jgi:hypothetical protein|nr:hypothetical protein [Micropepsaceae bacterium]
MPIYTFSALKPDDSVASTCILRTTDENEAREVANDLLLDDAFQIIEVRKDSQLICRVAKDQSELARAG